jgi:hypothetical protein
MDTRAWSPALPDAAHGRRRSRGGGRRRRSRPCPSRRPAVAGRARPRANRRRRGRSTRTAGACSPTRLGRRSVPPRRTGSAAPTPSAAAPTERSPQHPRARRRSCRRRARAPPSARLGRGRAAARSPTRPIRETSHLGSRQTAVRTSPQRRRATRGCHRETTRVVSAAPDLPSSSLMAPEQSRRTHPDWNYTIHPTHKGATHSFVSPNVLFGLPPGPEAGRLRAGRSRARDGAFPS